MCLLARSLLDVSFHFLLVFVVARYSPWVMYVRMALRLWVLIGWMARWPAGSLMPDDVAHGCHLACLVLQFGCLGLQKRALGNGSVAKNNFRRNWISRVSRAIFFMILCGFGSHCHGFCCLGGWLGNSWFFMVLLGSSRILSPWLAEGKLVVF